MSRRDTLRLLAAVAVVLFGIGALGLLLLARAGRRRAPEPAPSRRPAGAEPPFGIVDEASWESVPASDAPGWIGSGRRSAGDAR
jgi:hypothetical protein